MRFKAGIVDDEANGREFISLLLKNEFPQIDIIFEAASVLDVDIALKKYSVDVLFLDIQLKNKTVFQSQFLKRSNAAKIYVTAYDQYGIEAIKHNAEDYLLKPINELEFVNTVQKVLLSKINQIQQKTIANDFIDIPTSRGYQRLAIPEIVRCESTNNYTIIFLENKKQFVVTKPLADFEKQLCMSNFCRVHQSHLINLSYVKEYVKGKGGDIILKDGSKVAVSQRKKADFLNRLSFLSA
ncbi:LytR/AlgR family response regulator transcription factor [Kordia sp.]|uniref:LytR/AlgR family response regulator transcription factor n=1 Tax=Kordia sp. TaxID=1965332 RepID=UPI003D287942